MLPPGTTVKGILRNDRSPWADASATNRPRKDRGSASSANFKTAALEIVAKRLVVAFADALGKNAPQ